MTRKTLFEIFVDGTAMGAADFMDLASRKYDANGKKAEGIRDRFLACAMRAGVPAIPAFGYLIGFGQAAHAFSEAGGAPVTLEVPELRR